jgi:hypothetical protein
VSHHHAAVLFRHLSAGIPAVIFDAIVARPLPLKLIPTPLNLPIPEADDVLQLQLVRQILGTKHYGPTK